LKVHNRLDLFHNVIDVFPRATAPVVRSTGLVAAYSPQRAL